MPDPFVKLTEVCKGKAEPTQEMSLVHEATHIYLSTDDIVRTVEGCEELAEGKKDRKAIRMQITMPITFVKLLITAKKKKKIRASYFKQVF